jgi:polyhydroxybutyrate depolymerase
VASNPLPAWWGKNRKRVFAALAVLLALWVLFGGGRKPETKQQNIPKGYPSAGRPLLVHAPSNPADPLPLVLVLHEDHSSPADIERVSNASKVADRRDFAVVYPEAVNGTWRVADPRGADMDMGYLRDVVDYVAKQTKINKNRVYIWGYGLGGGPFALDAACTKSDHMFAVVGVVGKFDPEPVDTCKKNKVANVRVLRAKDVNWTKKTTDALWDGSQPEKSTRR